MAWKPALELGVWRGSGIPSSIVCDGETLEGVVPTGCRTNRATGESRSLALEKNLERQNEYTTTLSPHRLAQHKATPMGNDENKSVRAIFSGFEFVKSGAN